MVSRECSHTLVSPRSFIIYLGKVTNTLTIDIDTSSSYTIIAHMVARTVEWLVHGAITITEDERMSEAVVLRPSL